MLFCTFLSCFCTTSTWKCLISRVKEDVNKQRRNFISLSELVNMITWNSASGGFAYIWQSKWVGIIAVKTKRTEIPFLSDILFAVASLDLKVPNCLSYSSDRRFRRYIPVQPRCILAILWPTLSICISILSLTWLIHSFRWSNSRNLSLALTLSTRDTRQSTLDTPVLDDSPSE